MPANNVNSARIGILNAYLYKKLTGVPIPYKSVAGQNAKCLSYGVHQKSIYIPGPYQSVVVVILRMNFNEQSRRWYR